MSGLLVEIHYKWRGAGVVHEDGETLEEKKFDHAQVAAPAKWLPLWRWRTVGNLTQRVLLSPFCSLHSAFTQTIFPGISPGRRFCDFPWVSRSGQNSLRPEQATLNETPNIHLDCRPHITHRYLPNTSTTSEKKLERSPNELLNRQMEQGDTNAQLLGYGITRQLVLGELDTEIRVRERLQEAVESRIAWATCLQSSLGAVAEKQGACIVQG